MASAVASARVTASIIRRSRATAVFRALLYSTMLSYALRRASNGRIMIWNSIPFMTAIYLLIIAVTIYAIWRSQLIGPGKRKLAFG
jgi:hypothetical protein